MRSNVQSGDDVLIGGFIITGHAPKPIVPRTIGPYLTASFPAASLTPSEARHQRISNALPDPTLELYDVNGSLVFVNDNWRNYQEQQILGSTIPPSHGHESSIIATLELGNLQSNRLQRQRLLRSALERFK